MPDVIRQSFIENPMRRFLIPQIPLADLPEYLAFTLLGAALAGCYGVLHDQLTFTLSPEYFRNFKFEQFAYANAGLGDRYFVATIGFLATWWVGLIVTWMLARRFLPNQTRKLARRQIVAGFCIVFMSAFLAGAIGYLYATIHGPNADYSSWRPTLAARGVTDLFSFMRVGYIHNAKLCWRSNWYVVNLLTNSAGERGA